MAETDSAIPGVQWGRVQAHADDRGSFSELWRASSSTTLAADARFVQANVSLSKAGVLRGLHFHRRQLDLWVVLEGEVFVALVDLRRTTDETPRSVTRVLSSNDTVGIPEMVAHGFLALKPTRLFYLVTNEYDGTDEHGVAWDDPWIGISWPRVGTSDGRPILSDRDQENPSYRELRSRLMASR